MTKYLDRPPPVSTAPGCRPGPVATALSDRSEPVVSGRAEPAECAPRTPPRKDDDDARGCVRWLQERGIIGDIGWNALPDDPRRAGILDYYRWYCDEENTTPLRPLTFARALGRLAETGAIAKRQVPIGGRELTVYWIPDSIDRYWINHEDCRNAEDQRSH